MPDDTDTRPSRSDRFVGDYVGTRGTDRRATALIVANLGVVFITKHGVAIRTDQELRTP